MGTDAVRRYGIPLGVALLVLAVVLVVVRLSGPDDEVRSSTPGAGGGSAVPGNPGDSGAGSGAPASPGGSDAAEARFTSVRPGADNRSLDVTFYGGVEKCYDYEVTAAAGPGDAIELTLQETVTFDGACIELAQEYERTVELDSPLGEREVVDAATGQEVLAPSP